MTSIVLKAYIHAPIDQVWETISDHEGYTRFKGIHLAKVLKEGDKERNGVGAVREVHGMGVRFVEDIVTYDPPRLLEYKVVRCNRPIDHEIGRVELISRGEGTEIHWVSRFRMKIPLIGNWLAERNRVVARDWFYDFVLDMKEQLEKED
jgi:uncharacterized protein YndB with AHSA1/START domain